MVLNERRARFVYESARLAAIAAQAPIVPVVWEEREADFKAQFLRVMEQQCGPRRSHSPEELHGSWMEAYFNNGWVYGETYDREKRTHPDLVPYEQLGRLERDKDAVFVALCEIAVNYIYEMSEAHEEGQEMTKVSKLAETEGLPTPSDMRGLMPNLTEGKPSERYLKERWGGR